MTRKVTVSVKPTPRELEEELWEMNSLEQADFLLAMVQRFNGQTAEVLEQIYCMGMDSDNALNDDEKKETIGFIEIILEYLKGAYSDESRDLPW